MKLLLTSAGITNQSIANALAELTGRPPEQTKIGFITTAANIERGNKDWYIEQLINLQQYGFQWIDIVDIAVPSIDWKSVLATVDVIAVSGGNTFYLLEQMRSVNFAEWYKNNTRKVYVGMSAGSIVTTPNIAVASLDNGDVNLTGVSDLHGLEFVDFEISPHTPESVSDSGNRAYRRTITSDLYGLDNQSAIKYVDGELTVVSEGAWVKY